MPTNFGERDSTAKIIRFPIERVGPSRNIRLLGCKVTNLEVARQERASTVYLDELRSHLSTSLEEEVERTIGLIEDSPNDNVGTKMVDAGYFVGLLVRPDSNMKDIFQLLSDEGDDLTHAIGQYYEALRCMRDADAYLLQKNAPKKFFKAHPSTLSGSSEFVASVAKLTQLSKSLATTVIGSNGGVSPIDSMLAELSEYRDEVLGFPPKTPA